MSKLTMPQRNPMPTSQIAPPMPAKLHPRDHALTMASADHLHRQGYIGAAQHQSIRGQAQAKMDTHKAAAPAFGSLAPR